MKTRIIPKKYLNHSNARQAWVRLAKWCATEQGMNDLASDIVDAYEVANEVDRVYLGLLLSMVFELKSPTLARECASRFGMVQEIGCSMAATVYMSGMGGYDDVLLYRYLPQCLLLDYCKEMAYDDKLVSLFDNKYREGVYAIYEVSRKDKIYFCTHLDGPVRVFILNDCGESILVDEEAFNDEEPLYFTEYSHFVSPLFKVKAIVRFVEFFLKETGFPYVRLIPTMIFTSDSAVLINREDYDAGGEKEQDWKGCEALVKSDFRNTCMLYAITPKESLTKRQSLQYHLRLIFAAAALLYDKYPPTPSFFKDTDRKIRKMMREQGIVLSKTI